MDLNVVIAGEAGQGLKTVEDILNKTLFEMGYDIYSTKDYMSRVRGGHNFMSIRFGDERLTGPAQKEDILIALNEESIKVHRDLVVEEGIIIYDGEVEVDNKELLSVAASDIAQELGNPKVANTVFIGALLKALGLYLKTTEEVLKEYFDNEKIININLQALRKGYEQVEKKISLPFVNKGGQILINGNQALGLGAISAGVKFYAGYPMTPSTGVMNYIASKQEELGIVVEQAEDEIAAINMALGASYTGVRAMTGTSGGGFALMSEGLGLAGITETPLIIAEVQRPGPATGLPTRTEQADLQFVINASQGEFPLIVATPRSVEDCFYQTFRSFNLADKYQLPVVVLSDQFLADSTMNVIRFSHRALDIQRKLINEEEAENINNYQRYKLTEDGISPRAYPGQLEDQVVLVDSDEHDQFGNIIEDAETRIKMVDKRAQKMKTITKEESLEPEFAGENEIDYLIVCWGSTYGPALEAQKRLAADDYAVGLLSFNYVWPFPTEKLNKYAPGTKIVVVEGNSTAQFASLLESESDFTSHHNILKYDGRPFTGTEIYNRFIKEVIK
ncbi:2-oxoacid:acceptor oxidoreductase subunit alpha [Fuchsiella alkaliacetigena]|uniref:2-oxoacid:acceptor oxidoreductase subunit alpha n=1 Tax=Fuchsiella alkaliacetigena TaxID=957042 RepID=UPI00200B1761|nr:2-oxoacid:acceptor oxidoreductase subunit alpha [Fuchsiella alkaliacetigena]MCK8825075.1 2-oxoacid:acceptor oxidoreductase subunit alpha [Fuchsiella alkaliacetigena]